MRIEEIKNLCTCCTACKTVCPKKCITMVCDEEGFLYPKVNNDDCIHCGACENVCHCLTPIEKSTSHCTYFGASRDESVLHDSSSGGAFYHIAERVLEENGVVIGAAFDYKTRDLRHATTDDVDIKKIQKSKYVESVLGNIFETVSLNLNMGRRVLFCGTPCQVSGLKRAVKDPKDLLLTCDFVCHGVASGNLFKEHLDSLCKEEEIIDIDFRPKSVTWQDKQIVIRTSRKLYSRPYNLDSYYSGFMTFNAFLRRSCYDCQFRKRHFSDITLADFWGWRDFDPTLDARDGLSLMIANTKKGILAIERTRNFEHKMIDNHFSDYVFAEKDYSNGLALREKFYRYYRKYGFEQSARMSYFNFKWRFFREIKWRIKRVLNH